MTINLGSMITLKCAGIKKDMADLTASIHNLILSPINGDYDGSPYFSITYDNFEKYRAIVKLF